MNFKTPLKLALQAGAIIVVTACASTTDSASTATATATSTAAAAAAETETAVAAENKTLRQTAIETADELSATKNVTTSADGNVVCKRQAVIGSNFKRKICMTKAQWDQLEEESRQTTGDIQRRGGAPGSSN